MTRELAADVVIVGGGTAGCMAAVAAKEARPDLRVLIVEKAAIDRSGCLAAGMNAINAYLHPGETPESYTRYARYDACGLVREDLVQSGAALLNEAVARLEAWGLPIQKDAGGAYARRGRWNLKIHGEGLKPLLAAAARRAGAEIAERVAAVDLIVRDGRAVGLFGLGARDGSFYVIRAGAVIISTGGAAGIYRPVNPASGAALGWYCPFNAGTGYAMGLRAGAEMTSLEMRFIALRTKGILCPTGTLALGFGARQINARGEEYMRRLAEVGGEGAPTCYRIMGPIREIKEGRGPCYLDTRGLDALRVKEAKEAFLEMYPGIVLYWTANDLDPGREPVEITGTEPYLVGGHCQAGFWVDTERRTTLAGLYAAGDAAGGYPGKFVSGCLAEGIIAGRAAAAEAQAPPAPDTDLCAAERERILQPLRLPARAGIDPAPTDFLERLQWVTEFYAGGAASFYELNEERLAVARRELERLAERVRDIRARDCHELIAAHEAADRLVTARAMVEHLLYRRETRWPGFQTRLDFPARDDHRWLVFVNSIYDRDSGRFSIMERPYNQIIPGDRYLP